MAEERNVGLERAPETETPSDATKEELQRRMDEARESITQTVTEIKETVVNQYQQVRESISDSLDWREQYRRHTIPFTVGAVVGGLALGYGVGGALFGADADDDYYDEEEDYDTEESNRQLSAPRPYAAQPVIGGPSSRSARPAPLRAAAAPSEDYSAYGSSDVGSEARPSYAVASEPQYAAEEEEPKGPGLFERFKETKAYDRLQQELYTLGDRAVEELSKTAQTVVLPAILGKVKDLIGIDLGTQREVAKRSQLEQQAAKASAAAASAAGTNEPPR